jgi:ABC-type sugar transport system substrate-binding protein
MRRFWRMPVTAGLVGLCAAAAVAAAGAVPQAGAPPAKTPAARTAQARAAAAVDAKRAGKPVAAPKGKTIGYIHLSSQTEASLRVLAGLQQIGKVFGFKVIACDPNFDAIKTRQCATTIVAQHPDIVITEARDAGQLDGGMEQAKKQGIPWIGVGALQTASPNFTAQYVPDEKQLTHVLDTWMFGQIDKKFGKGTHEIAAVQAPPVGPGVRDRDVQRKADLKAFPNIKEVETHDLDLSNPVQDMLSWTAQVVGSHPGLAGLWQTCDFCVAPMAQALDAKGLTGAKRPVLAGIYSTRETRKDIQQGTVDGVVENNFDAMGWVAMDQALEHWARGTKFWPNNSVFKKAYSISILNPWIETKANVGTNINEVKNNGEDFKTYFLTKWKLEFGK